jgi:hypothetical protein
MVIYPFSPWLVIWTVRFLSGTTGEGAGGMRAGTALYDPPGWYWLLWPMGLLVLVLAIVAACRRRGWGRLIAALLWAPLAVGILGVAAFEIGVLEGYAWWSVRASTRVDGVRYVAIRNLGFWGDDYYGLAVSETGWTGPLLGHTYHVLGGGDSRPARLVRPAEPQWPNAPRLCPSPTGQVVFLSEGNVCQLIYDPATDEFLPPSSCPFILLGPDDRPRPEDIHSALWARDPYSMGPVRHRAALQHPSPHVRALAEEVPTIGVPDE